MIAQHLSGSRYRLDASDDVPSVEGKESRWFHFGVRGVQIALAVALTPALAVMLVAGAAGLATIALVTGVARVVDAQGGPWGR